MIMSATSPYSVQTLIKFLRETITGFTSKVTEYLGNVGVSSVISFKSLLSMGYLSNFTSFWERDIGDISITALLITEISLTERRKYCVSNSAPSSILGINGLHCRVEQKLH